MLLLAAGALLAIVLVGLAYRWATSEAGAVEQLVPAADVRETIEPAKQVASAVPSPTVLETSTPPPTPTPKATIAVTPTPLPTPEFLNAELDTYRQLAESWQAEFVVADQSNTGLWQFGEDTLVHPIALVTKQETAYLIDSGRVMSLDLQNPGSLRTLLAPGGAVENVVVMEPLDLDLTDDFLFVLDRAGDVYKYHFADRTWQLDRYDRPAAESSGEYFVALAAAQSEAQSEPGRALLETNYKFAQIYDSATSRIWRLPELRGVDIDYFAGDAYVLQRALYDNSSAINKYHDTGVISSFRPRIESEDPLQVIATEEGVYVLDQGGRRLLLFDSQYGALLRMMQLPQDQPASAVAVDKKSGTLLMAGQDRLYLFGRPQQRISVMGDTKPVELQAHDPRLLAQLDDFVVPVGGSNISVSDFQLPGAPRHYRLGVHRGLDFYWQPGTKVLAAGDGVIIRADTDYVDPSAADLAAWYAESTSSGFTPEDILDNYMGRQVWIEHEPGIVSRYAHLRGIEPGIEAGVSVSRGQPIGEVGNTGSPASLEGESADAHLHYELWLGDTYLGEYLRPSETRDWIEQIYPTSR
ncbi:MAG: M23 family metallopeptidase [Candidatus Promineifilaceae bacterium]